MIFKFRRAEWHKIYMKSFLTKFRRIRIIVFRFTTILQKDPYCSIGQILQYLLYFNPRKNLFIFTTTPYEIIVLIHLNLSTVKILLQYFLTSSDGIFFVRTEITSSSYNHNSSLTSSWLKYHEHPNLSLHLFNELSFFQIWTYAKYAGWEWKL